MVSALLACFAGKAFFVKMTTAEQYQAERDRLERNRSLDWTTCSQDFVVAGETLKPMTVQVWFDLLALKSPILYNEAPTIASVVDYIWKHSQKKTNNKLLKVWRLFWLQRRVIKTLKHKSDGPDMIYVLSEHIKSSLDEFPIDSSGSSTRKVNTMPVVAGEASMIDELASRYSIHPCEVLEMPLRRAFALQRVIRTSTIPDYKTLEADSLRAIKSKYLQELNNGQK